MSHPARPWSMARVVTASSAGTAFEWYDFFIFGSLAFAALTYNLLAHGPLLEWDRLLANKYTGNRRFQKCYTP